MMRVGGEGEGGEGKDQKIFKEGACVWHHRKEGPYFFRGSLLQLLKLSEAKKPKIRGKNESRATYERPRRTY